MVQMSEALRKRLQRLVEYTCWMEERPVAKEHFALDIEHLMDDAINETLERLEKAIEQTRGYHADKNCTCGECLGALQAIDCVQAERIEGD